MEKRWAEKYIGNDYVKGSPSFSKIVVINGNIKRLEAQYLVKNGNASCHCHCVLT